MQNKKYMQDDLDVAKINKEEEIYERVFKNKVKKQINRFFPTQQLKEQFLDQYCLARECDHWPLRNRNIEANFNRCIDVFTEMSFEHGPFLSFFEFVGQAADYIRALQLERNTIYNNFANYLLNNHGNEINNTIQQAQQNMENRLRDEEARFLNNQRIINNQVLQNARNEVENRANAFFNYQENQIQNQMNQIQDRANQFFNNEYRKYRDVLQQKHQLNKENEKLKAYNATLKKEHKEMNELLKFSNQNYIYNRQIFGNLSRQTNVLKKINKTNNLKSVLPQIKINNYVKNTRDNVDKDTLHATKSMLQNLPNLNIKYNNQKFY